MKDDQPNSPDFTAFDPEDPNRFGDAARAPSPGEAEQASPITQPAAPAVTAAQTQTAIIGTSLVGKTFLLAAFQQACMLSGASGYQLTFIPKSDGANQLGRSAPELVRQAVDRIVTGKGLLKSDWEVNRYSFQIECRAPWFREPSWRGRPQRTFMSVLDGPGGSLFPTKPTDIEDEFRSAMVGGVQESDNLVICVNCLRPELASFRSQFAALVDQAGGPDRHTLGANRVLLLLTKVDEVAERLLKSVNSYADNLHPDLKPSLALEVLTDPARNNERRLTELMNPIEIARSVLDQASISMIRRSLNSSAHMAIGLCSSTGFRDDGRPFWDNALSDTKPGYHQSPDDRLRIWKPFGVEEVILFLLTGRTSPSLRTYTLEQDRLTCKALRQLELRMTVGRPTTAASHK